MSYYTVKIPCVVEGREDDESIEPRACEVTVEVYAYSSSEAASFVSKALQRLVDDDRCP